MIGDEQFFETAMIKSVEMWDFKGAGKTSAWSETIFFQKAQIDLKLIM